MSSIVDSCPEAVETVCPRCADAGLFDSLVKGRFVALAAVVTAALGLGFGGGGGEESPEAAVAELPGLRLDPNTVPPQVLTALPHVGSSLVDRWVKAREERPFRSLEDARARVRGLGAATIEQIAPFVDFPEVRRQDSKSIASRKAARPPAKLRTASRKKSGSTNKPSATQPARLASQPVRPSDR
jgi:DNA uptake protein ComE-like DNA-binding protein